MKKFLSIVLSVAMILGTMSTVVFADGAGTTYQVGADKTYTDLNSAIVTNNGAEDAIYEIYGEVELEIPGTHGDFEFNGAKVVGMDNEAQVTVVGGGVSDIVNVNMENIKFADEGTYNNSSSEFMYQNFSGKSSFSNVSFLDGVRFCNSYVGTAAVITAEKCSFYEESENEYTLWIDGGVITVTDSVLEGTRGVKMGDARYAADNLELEVSGCEFKNIYKKPAFVVSNVDAASTIEIEETTLTDCDYGLLVNEVADYSGITVDGKNPVYVASKGNEYYTDMAYALKEADGDSSALTEYVAEVNGTYYTNLVDAVKARGDINLLADVDLQNVEWEPASLKGNFNGNGHTISNLKINKPDNNNVGFITSLNGVFENVNFVNVDVVGKENVGAVAGRTGGSGALVKNVTVTGDIKVESTSNGYARAAVIVGGWAYGRYIDITVDGGSSDTSYVKHTGGGDGRYCAGIVGHADDVDEYTNCVVRNITIDGDWLCGGIAGPGPSDGIATGCVVENVKIASDYSGGMFGWYYGDGTIEDSTVKNVEFTDGGTNNGAIGGYGMAPNVGVKNVTIENVVNYGGAPMISYLAAIDDNYYATLDVALEAAVDGDTITLLADNEIENANIKKNVTIDLNDNTLTVDAEGIMDNAAGGNAAIWTWKAVTIKNGNIVVNSDAKIANGVFYIAGKTDAKLTLDDVVLTANNTNGTDLFVSCEPGMLEILYSTINAEGVSKLINGGDGGKATIKYSEINVANSDRAIVNIVLDAGWSTIDIDNMADNALRNVSGRIHQTTIDVEGAACGLKNDGGKELSLTGTSTVTLTGATEYDLYLKDGAKLNVGPSSVLYANTSYIANHDDTSGNLVAKAEKVYVQFKKVDVDANNNDTVEGSDEYEIVLAGYDEEAIHELASADLTFAFDGTLVSGGKMDYTVIPAKGVTLTNVPNTDRYMFNYDGVTKYEETGKAIVIGTITIEGYGSYTLGTDATVTTNAVYATEIRDSIVDGFENAAELVVNEDMLANDGMVGETGLTEIAVPTRTLTINIDFYNTVENNAAVYQDMEVRIVGGTVDKKIALGEDTDADADYTVVEDLPYNTAYTVTVSGAGYRTARYTVNLNDHKTLNFWNNVMDENHAIEVEEGLASSKTTKNFLAGDIVKDNNINIYDLSAVVSYFSMELDTDAYSTYAKYDLNRDGFIDSKDVAYVLVSWGK